jgi:MoxR-like ATPase
VLSFDAVADGVAVAALVRRIVDAVPLPQITPSQGAHGPGLGVAA